MSILSRYVLKELLAPFAFGLFLFLTVLASGFVLTRLTQLVSETGMSAGDAFRFFWLSLPQYVTYSFPMALLAAILWGFGRLSGEQELTAMRVGGFGVRRAAVPGVLLGLVVSVSAALFNEYVVPPANRGFHELMRRAQGEGNLTLDHLVFTKLNGDTLDWIIYMEHFSPRDGRIDGLYAVHSGGSEDLIIRARTGTWQQDDWLLKEGRVSRNGEGGASNTVVPFAQLTARAAGLGLDPPGAIAQRTLRANDMSWHELREYLTALARTDKRFGLLEWEMHTKMAVPFASLVFALIAIPLAIRPARGGSWLKVGFAAPIIIGYYVLWHLLGVAAARSVIPPLAAAWAPNVLLALVGTVMLFRTR